ncbi:helix-turn-helix transcriptional regulator [Clostridium estertheticum]|uniref:XRE family transcriptional regulator n=1 Tax=Clostridium estertheticum subsp. estertheticum TaxID=1552 RepID=A0A1J0GJV2_9CLOT|nr:helix-turn-helix transcriptional regulator [Clostridium estertheticum]APC41559.1 XRE family transcriptional regulator [Clostridium estertheticum subsp. estertheticum]
MNNKIREFIKDKGLKASDVIKETGLSKSYFYDVMNCNSIPSLTNARKISSTIGVTLDELFPNKKKGE